VTTTYQYDVVNRLTQKSYSDTVPTYTNGTPNKNKREITARMVVDASGRRTFLGHCLDLRVRDQHFDQYALHTWFRGYDRSVLANAPHQDNFIFIHFLPLSNWWVWQIPITEVITSVGGYCVPAFTL